MRKPGLEPTGEPTPEAHNILLQQVQELLQGFDDSGKKYFFNELIKIINYINEQESSYKTESSTLEDYEESMAWYKVYEAGFNFRKTLAGLVQVLADRCFLVEEPKVSMFNAIINQLLLLPLKDREKLTRTLLDLSK